MSDKKTFCVRLTTRKRQVPERWRWFWSWLLKHPVWFKCCFRFFPLGAPRTRVIETNDTKSDWKEYCLDGMDSGSVHCARKIAIRDTAAAYSETETAALKSGTGDGLVDYFTKVKEFVNGGTTTYSIDEVVLYEATLQEFAVEAVGPPESYPPGGSLEVEYEGTVNNDAALSGDMTTYGRRELARAFGQDKDSEALACGGCNNGTIKLYYDQPPATPQMPIEKTCLKTGSGTATDTTYGYRTFMANDFYHATHNAAFWTKVVVIPTDGLEAHALAEDTTGGGPVDLTGNPSFSFTLRAHE